MGLYDRYQLANSQGIKQYQGSTVPELVQVSQELQRRYDTVQDTNDYMSRFLNSLQALPQDQDKFTEWSKGYRGKIADIAKRPDLENAVRETTMLARNLPDEYSPFGQRVKDFSERKSLLDKDVHENKITPETASKLLARDIKNDRGLQIDPNTGRYTGRFSGQNYVKDLNVNEKVDKWLDHVYPTTQGYSREQIGNQWIIKKGGKTVTLGPDRIRSIIQSGANSDTEFQAWMQQQQDLGTLSQDYSKLDPSTVSAKVIQPLLDKGYSFGDAMKIYHQNSIGQDIMSRAYDYGNKYIRNDQESSVGYDVNSYGLSDYNRAKDKEAGAALQVASTMTLGGANVASAADFNDVKQQTQQTHTDAMQQYADWQRGKSRTPDGKVWQKDENGKWIDVTSDAEQFRGQIQYAQDKKDQMKSVEAAATRASGYTITPQLKKQAEAASAKALPRPDELEGLTGADRQLVLDGAKRRAYNEVLQNTSGYKRYEEELKKRMQGTTVGTDLFAFTNEKTVDALSSQIENLVSGLGLKKGMIPVEIGSGANKGQQLSSDDWDELKGKMKVIGTTVTGDPNSPVGLVVRAFKNVKGKKTEGEDMIIRLPHTNIESIAKDNMTDMQFYYMQKSAGLASALNNSTRTFKVGDISIKANTEDQRGGWTVKKGNTQQTLYSFKEIIDYLDQQQ